MGFLGSSGCKESACSAGDPGLIPEIRKFLWRKDRLSTLVFLGPGDSDGKEITYNAGDLASIPGLGRSPGGGLANHSSILAWRIPMHRGAWQLQSMGSRRVGHN